MSHPERHPIADLLTREERARVLQERVERLEFILRTICCAPCRYDRNWCYQHVDSRPCVYGEARLLLGLDKPGLAD